MVSGGHRRPRSKRRSSDKGAGAPGTPPSALPAAAEPSAEASESTVAAGKSKLSRSRQVVAGALKSAGAGLKLVFSALWIVWFQDVPMPALLFMVALSPFLTTILVLFAQSRGKLDLWSYDHNKDRHLDIVEMARLSCSCKRA